MRLPRDTAVLAALFAVSGVLHLVKPEAYEPLMPPWVPRHREVILGSGLAELACAAGLAVPATRRTAGWASVLLLVGVFPGNVHMAADAQRIDSTSSRARVVKAVTLLRLPVQWPMIRAAMKVARG
jgi:uncharacterized membrane protein